MRVSANLSLLGKSPWQHLACAALNKLRNSTLSQAINCTKRNSVDDTTCRRRSVTIFSALQGRGISLQERRFSLFHWLSRLTFPRSLLLSSLELFIAQFLIWRRSGCTQTTTLFVQRIKLCNVLYLKIKILGQCLALLNLLTIFNSFLEQLSNL